MTTYERPLYIRAQVVMGVWDEDGNLVGKREVLEIRDVCYPYGLILEQYVDELTRQSLPQREEQRR